MSASAQYAICTHNMLEVISLLPSGNLYKTFNYVGKDIIGQIGGLIFMVGKSKKYNENPLFFVNRLNLYQQTSFFSLFIINEKYFLPLSGLSNIFMNISFIGYGAINVKILNEIGKKENNLGELYMKFTAINTIASTVGTLIGVGLTAVCLNNETYKFILLTLLGIIRVYSYKKSVKIIFK